MTEQHIVARAMALIAEHRFGTDTVSEAEAREVKRLADASNSAGAKVCASRMMKIISKPPEPASVVGLDQLIIPSIEDLISDADHV